MPTPIETRQLLYSLLGDLPDRHRPIRVLHREVSNLQHYTLEKLTLDLNHAQDVPAYFAKPLGATGKLPTILYNHAHGGDYMLGKDELTQGRELLQQPPYAIDLTRRGYAVLCIDTWAFGERATRTESDIFKEMLWRGQVMWGMMVFDSIRAIDYLVSRDDVDEARLGTIGLSMGSTMAWWTAALDERIKVVVDLCCLTDFESLIRAGGLECHGVYYFVPSLLKHFTCSQINALIAPRPHLGLAGDLDRLTPAEGLLQIDADLKRAYASAGAPEAWKLLRFPVDHQETPEMRLATMEWLARWL